LPVNFGRNGFIKSAPGVDAATMHVLSAFKTKGFYYTEETIRVSIL
jgi:hypothetical protein